MVIPQRAVGLRVNWLHNCFYGLLLVLMLWIEDHFWVNKGREWIVTWVADSWSLVWDHDYIFAIIFRHFLYPFLPFFFNTDRQKQILNKSLQFNSVPSLVMHLLVHVQILNRNIKIIICELSNLFTKYIWVQVIIVWRTKEFVFN